VDPRVGLDTVLKGKYHVEEPGINAIIILK
jgi:hypothetical protein